MNQGLAYISEMGWTLKQFGTKIMLAKFFCFCGKKHARNKWFKKINDIQPYPSTVSLSPTAVYGFQLALLFQPTTTMSCFVQSHFGLTFSSLSTVSLFLDIIPVVQFTSVPPPFYNGIMLPCILCCDLERMGEMAFGDQMSKLPLQYGIRSPKM